MGYLYTHLIYMFLALFVPSLVMAETQEFVAEHAVSAHDAAEELVVCVPVDNAPFSFFNEENELDGFNLEVFNALNLEQDTQMDIVSMATGFARIQDGTCHMFLAHVTVTKEREQDMLFSHVYMRSGAHALIFKESPIVTNDNLVYSVVGTIKGSVAEQFAFENLSGSIIYALRDYETLTRMLLEGNIEALLGAKPVLQTIRESHDQLHILEPPLIVEEYVYAFTHGQERLRDDVDVALARLQENNTLQELLRKWFPNILPSIH